MLGDQEDDSREADVSSDCSASLSPEEEIIRHKVSKHDNLAGLAIKYGVTVFDIKAVNGLHSDAAMFARDTLIIPIGKGGDLKDHVNREAMVRFVGGLRGRLPESGLGRDSSSAGAQPQASPSCGLFSFHQSAKPLQEIELHEHVGYAGSRSGIEERPLLDNIRRRKRDDDPDIPIEGSREHRGLMTNQQNAPGRPPVPPGRDRDQFSSGPVANQGEAGPLLGMIMGWQTSFLGRFKEVMNSPAFGEAPLQRPVKQVRPGSSLGTTPRRSDPGLSRVGSSSSLNSITPKDCPKAD